MRRNPEDFSGQDLRLVYIARKLKDALELEERLTDAGLDYVVESDRYSTGTIFRSERVGAFFYVQSEAAETAHVTLRRFGYLPYEE